MIAYRASRIVCAVSLLVVLVAPSPAVRAAEPPTIVPLLDGVLASVNDYWRDTLTASGHPAPSVRHVWVARGAKRDTACGRQAGDDAAFYCPADDTIYIGQALAGAILDGVANGLPGQRLGLGRAAGDFAVAYVVAHEYAHDVQKSWGSSAARARCRPSSTPTAWPAHGRAGPTIAGSWSRETSRKRSTPRWPSETSISRAPSITERPASDATR